MSYSWYKKTVISFLIIYFTIGLAARFTAKGAEDFYPFFSWFLFSEVPSRIQQDFTLRIHSAGGQQFVPPELFENARELHNTKRRSYSEYYHLIQSLGRSLVQRRDTEVARIRAQLEQRFAVHPVTYEVVRATYNPIERWKYGTVIELESIATFDSQYTSE